MWEYQIVRAETSEALIAILNARGRESWEAISGGYGIGESKKISLGQGMPLQTTAGAPMWTTLLKRAIATNASAESST